MMRQSCENLLTWKYINMEPIESFMLVIIINIEPVVIVYVFKSV
jgi:hypothetical protein